MHSFVLMEIWLLVTKFETPCLYNIVGVLSFEIMSRAIGVIRHSAFRIVMSVAFAGDFRFGTDFTPWLTVYLRLIVFLGLRVLHISWRDLGDGASLRLTGLGYWVLGEV